MMVYVCEDVVQCLTMKILNRAKKKSARNVGSI